VNIHNILLWMNSGMEMPAPMVNGILNNAVFHSSPRINQLWHTKQDGYFQCICQVRSITAHGVVLNDKLTAADHVSSILTSCSSSLYALRVLRGLQTSSLHDVFRATILASYDTVPRRGRAFARL